MKYSRRLSLTISFALSLSEPITTITNEKVLAIDYPDIYLCLSAKDMADISPQMENNFFVSTVLDVSGILSLHVHQYMQIRMHMYIHANAL